MSFTMMRVGLPRSAAFLAFALTAIFAAPALASGGGGGGGGGSESSSSHQDRSKSQTDLTTCERGKVWNAKTHKCLPRHSGVLPDSELADYAFALAKAERYEEALQV